MLRVVVVAFLILLLLSYFFMRWFRNAPPRQVVTAFKRALLLGLAVALIALAASGRAHWLVGVLGGLLPVTQRMLAVWRAGKVLRGRFWRHNKAGNTAQVSQVSTRYLRMSLDHDTGELSGVVLEGRFKGRRLDELGRDDLIDLLRQWQVDDDESARLLETYLDRMFGGWREQVNANDGGAAPTSGGAMNREEAYQILGLSPGASDAEIREAHRRLMQKMHPDRGGSTYLAAKINQAKDMLLRG